MDTDTGEFFQRDRSQHPPAFTPGYKSSVLRSPRLPLWSLQNSLSEVTGPVFRPDELGPLDNDLILNYAQDGEPIGERTVVHGHVRDENGRGVPQTLVELWQANAGGRYRHAWGAWPTPLDPNFSGAGRCITDDDGGFRFVTIKPGPYPWGNHYNAWRPAHIHFSLLGRAFAQRLVTQMYFPGDPLFAYDPIFNGVHDEAARQRMVSRFSLRDTVPNWAQAYRFDIVLRGSGATPFEEAHG